jgi:methylaspartate ammonia-lyase
MQPNLKTAAMAHFEAKRQAACANLRIYLENPVGIGEHSNLLEEVIKLTKQLAEAEDCLKCFRSNIRVEPGE